MKKQMSENQKRGIATLQDLEDTESPMLIGQHPYLEKFIRSIKNIRKNGPDQNNKISKNSKNPQLKRKISDKDTKETHNHSRINVSIAKNDKKNSKDRSKSIDHCSNRLTFMDAQLRQLYEKEMRKSTKKIDSVKSGNLSIKGMQKVVNKRLQKTAELIDKFENKEVMQCKKSMKKSHIKIQKIPSIQLDFIIGSNLLAEKRGNATRKQQKEALKKEESESKRIKNLKTDNFENSIKKKQFLTEFPAIGEAAKSRIPENCYETQKVIKVESFQMFLPTRNNAIYSKQKHTTKISQENMRWKPNEVFPTTLNAKKNNKHSSSKIKVSTDKKHTKQQNKITQKKPKKEVKQLKMETSKSQENLVNSNCANFVTINKNNIRNSKFVDNFCRKPSNKLKVKNSNKGKPSLKKLKTDSSRSRSKHLFRKLDTIICKFQNSDKKSIRSFIQKQNKPRQTKLKIEDEFENQSVIYRHQGNTEESFRTRECAVNIEEFFGN